MNIVRKLTLTIIFTLLITACESSTSTKNSDKNVTENQHVITNDKNETQNVPENNETQNVPENNTTQNVPENNATQNIPENNATQNVPENNTTQNVPENNTTQNVPENNATQNIPENNATQNVPENNTTQNVPENNTTQNVPENNTTQNVPENNATIYENAENNKTNNWTIISNRSGKASILNTYDDKVNSRVIYLNAEIKDGDRKSYDTFKFSGVNSNKNNKYLKWDMKFNQKFTISINIKTKNGNKWLNYIAKDTGTGINIRYPESIVHGIGSNKTNNNWHTITRDLDRDVKRYEANNSFMSINYITIRGAGYIDNITSYSSEENLTINKPVTVSKPGIVLTFDDSYIANWNKMQPTFKEKGAVATFFCNRWASNQGWNLPDSYIAILKSFQVYGHEIAYHTSDHVNTRDKRYNNKENKAQAYLDEQITPGVIYMRKKGFEPTSFSYPFISGQPAHNELIRQELPHIREFFAHVTLLDEPGKKSLADIRRHLEKLKKDQEIGVFLSHWIHYIGENDTESEKHKYKIEQETLIQIMEMIDELGLEYYTLEEAHNIYMNQ